MSLAGQPVPKMRYIYVYFSTAVYIVIYVVHAYSHWYQIPKYILTRFKSFFVIKNTQIWHFYLTLGVNKQAIDIYFLIKGAFSSNKKKG